MAAKPDLHRSCRVDQPLVGRIGPPVRRGFLRAKKMINRREDVGVRVEMKKSHVQKSVFIPFVTANTAGIQKINVLNFGTYTTVR